MISVTFVGLVLTTSSHLGRLFGRPLRPDVPLASHFPAWVDAGYGHVIFPSDEAVEAVSDTTKDVDELHVEADDVSFANTVKRVPVSLSLPSALKDAELDEEDADEFNSLAAPLSMDDLLVYRPNVGPLADDVYEDIETVADAEETTVFPFAGLDLLIVAEASQDNFEIEAEVDPVSTTGLRADAPEFRLPSSQAKIASAFGLRLDAVAFTPRGPVQPTSAVSLAPTSSRLRADVTAFTPRGSTPSVPAVAPAAPSSPLRQDAPAFRSRNALTIAYESRRTPDIGTTRDALTLACASRVGFVTPKHVLNLETPRRRRRRACAAPVVDTAA